MIEHVEDSSIPKEIPTFAKSLFIEQATGKVTTLAAATTTVTKNNDTTANSRRE